MRLVWTARAKARLRQIHAYIAHEGHPINADRVVERYQRDDIRELIEPPYRIVYLIGTERIDILTVRDTRRLLPRRLDDL